MASVRGLAHRKIAIAILGGLGLVSSASANGLMATGGPTSQPIGHFEFCKANAKECSMQSRDVGPVHMTAALKEKLAAINTDFNAAIKPVSDREAHGTDEVWSYADEGIGDCEDYVLEKRRQLRRDGISLANLLITVVRKRNGEGHAVLTVRTDEGDYILDNLSDEVKLWSQTGYRYLKRQSSSHTGRWVSLREENNLLVGAVNR